MRIMETESKHKSYRIIPYYAPKPPLFDLDSGIQLIFLYLVLSNSKTYFFPRQLNVSTATGLLFNSPTSVLHITKNLNPPYRTS